MAKALRVVGKVAGVIATVATFTGNPILAVIFAAVAVTASIGAQLLTKPPPARGSVSRMLIDPNGPTPYAMGEGLVGGVLRHDTAYGPTLKKVPNPYRFMAVVYSLGPVQSISPRINFETVPSWYNGFLFTDTQLGATPEATALSPQWSGTPGWTSAHKLSGLAAIGWSFLFDKDGKRFASGIDPLAAYGQWVLVYDPRKDSTFPGGSGSHRLGDESTYEWSENPALHAATYAYGRYQNGKRVFGIGMPADGIDWNVVAAWANVCDANEWTIFGVIGEPGDRWANLKDICYAGGAEPIPGGVLTFKYSAPKVALDTVTTTDVVTDDEMSVVTMQSYRDRLNTVVPRYISPENNWEMVDAGAVVNTTFLTEDGEEKRDVWPFNFVKNARQAAQLAAYRLFDSREISPITLVCKPRLRHYRPGECLYVDVPELGIDSECIILSRNIDPVTMKVTLELMTETDEKHDFCLGRTASPPPTPAIGQTAQERDETSGSVSLDPVPVSAIRNEFVVSNNGTADNGLWQAIDSVTIVNAPAGTANFVSFGGSFFEAVTFTGSNADFEARLMLNGVEAAVLPSQPVISGGVLVAADFAPLFEGTFDTPNTTVTFELQLRRTSGDARILTSSTRLDLTIIAN
jgi:hypothetical protein